MMFQDTKQATEEDKQLPLWIRSMVMTDIPHVVLMASDMHKESIYRELDFNPKKIMELCETIINNPDVYFGYIYDDGEIKGLCAGYITPHFFGDDLTSGDLAVYVKPEFRKGRVGVSLIKAYTDHCLSRGVKEPLLGVSAGINVDRIGALYERLGYTGKYTIYKMTKQ